MQSLQKIITDNEAYRPDRFTLKSMAIDSLRNATTAIESLLKFSTEESEQISYLKLLTIFNEVITDLTRGR